MNKNSLIIKNRKARFNYIISEKLEAGIVLSGSEIKAVRSGSVVLDSSYATEKTGEIWLFNLHITSSNYNRNFNSEDSVRPKKLLLKKKEIKDIIQKVKNNGYTVIPLNIHFNTKGFAKVELGISKGRKKEDLREYKKQQDWNRTKERLFKKQ